MDKFVKQILIFLRGLSAGQKMLLLFSAALVSVTVYIFVRLMGGGDYKPLYVGLTSGDAQSIGQRLAEQNINYQISTDGTSVLVPADQLDKARVGIASQGPLSSGRMGFELFDKPNWSGSDFSEKVNYQRALEAELERTIQTMSGIEAVRVHLVLPRESLFSDRERPAKAAVVVKLRGMRMSDQVSASIANLVSSAWDDLTPQRVSVITTDGQMPGSGHSSPGESLSGLGDLETAMAEKVVQVLTPIVGSDHVKSSVTIEYDPTSGESTQESYDPNATAVLSSQVSQENSQGLEPAGIPGTPSNAPNAPPSGAAADASKGEQTTQGIRTENKTFAVSHTTRHLVEPPGRIKRVAAAILVDDAVETKPADGKAAAVTTRRKRTPEEMKQIEDLAKAALGWNSARGDQISVQEVAFQEPQVETPLPPALPDRIRVVAEKWIGLIRYAALLLLFLLVYFLLLHPVMKRVLAALQAAEVRISTGRGELPAGAGVASAQLGQPPGTEGLLPQTTGVSPEFQRAVALKQQIVEKVTTEPENAGRLVQNWLRSA
jgi:flagellar M-ring protein FliF